MVGRGRVESAKRSRAESLMLAGDGAAQAVAAAVVALMANVRLNTAGEEWAAGCDRANDEADGHRDTPSKTQPLGWQT